MLALHPIFLQDFYPLMNLVKTGQSTAKEYQSETKAGMGMANRI